MSQKMFPQHRFLYWFVIHRFEWGYENTSWKNHKKEKNETKTRIMILIIKWYVHQMKLYFKHISDLVKKKILLIVKRTFYKVKNANKYNWITSKLYKCKFITTKRKHFTKRSTETVFLKHLKKLFSYFFFFFLLKS